VAERTRERVLFFLLLIVGNFCGGKKREMGEKRAKQKRANKQATKKPFNKEAIFWKINKIV
jgi:hypothetical protein